MTTAMDIDDVVLMQRMSIGDEAALAIVIERWSPRLYRFAVTSGMSPADGEAVVQDVFIRLWQHRERYRPRQDSSFTTFIFTIAHRLIIDVTRRKGHQSLAITEEIAVLSSPERDSEVWAIARSRLSERDHMLLWLRYGENQDISHIATNFGIGESACKVALHRARERLEPYLQQWSIGQNPPLRQAGATP